MTIYRPLEGLRRVLLLQRSAAMECTSTSCMECWHCHLVLIFSHYSLWIMIHYRVFISEWQSKVRSQEYIHMRKSKNAYICKGKCWGVWCHAKHISIMFILSSEQMLKTRTLVSRSTARLGDECAVPSVVVGPRWCCERSLPRRPSTDPRPGAYEELHYPELEVRSWNRGTSSRDCTAATDADPCDRSPDYQT